jgi:starch synthase
LGAYCARFPGRIGLWLTFDDDIARNIYAGSDMYLMPSRLEPCGLGQMRAMRYGSVPIVRAVGGLADTVRNYSPVTGEGYGFVFRRYDPMALYTAVVRAVETYRHADVWVGLQQACMSRDFSAVRAAKRYVSLYRRAQQLHASMALVDSPADNA